MDDINWVKKFASNKDFKKKISFFLKEILNSELANYLLNLKTLV